MIKALIFDFDGVLVESVDVKTDAFCELFKDYPQYLGQVKAFHLANGGISRYEKLRYYYKRLLKKPLSGEKLRELGTKFRRLVVDKVLKAPYVPGALDLLQKCRGKYRLFVASGTPEGELRAIVRKRNLTKWFHGTYGSPKDKEAILRQILRANGLKPGEAVFFGDSRNDAEAARKTGVPFFARSRKGREPWLKGGHVLASSPDLRGAYALLGSLNGGASPVKQALITGAGAGIGLACARKFLASGWRVFAHYHRSRRELESLKRRGHAGSLVLLRADFGDVAQAERFLAKVRGTVFDAVVNNAAADDRSSARSTGERIRKARTLFTINVILPALLGEAVLENMKSRKRGSIVNVSSIAAKYGSGGRRVFYGASKRALEAVTKTLARDAAPHGVLVNTVRPGVTDTGFHAGSGKDMGKRRSMIPLKRLARAEEIADLVYFLCSENAFITSEVLTIAGGE